MPATFHPKKRFQISGTNVNFVPSVSFGGAPVEELVYEGTTGISGVVPADALTSELFINNGVGLAPYGMMQVVLDSESQVVGGYLDEDTVSGEAGSLISITGENFYHITEVKFGEASGLFNVESQEDLTVLIPTNAGYGGITVFSSERTGLVGSITEASGISPNFFVPIANVTGLSSGTLTSGESLVIQGESLSAVTGVSFPKMEVHPSAISVSSVTPTSLNLIIPSGRVQGSPTMHMRSGITKQSLPQISFSQSVEVKDINLTGHRGSILSVFGHNFTTGTLHPIGEIEGSSPSRSGYLVGFGDSTGMFDLDPSYESPVIEGLRRLSGVIPLDTPIEMNSGLVGVGTNTASLIKKLPLIIYKNDFPLQYASTGKFRPIPEAPVARSVIPSSGISGDSLIIQGNNLFSVSGVVFSGYAGAGNVGSGESWSALDVSQISVNGTEIEVRVPTGVANAVYETNYGLVISGSFGEALSGIPADYSNPPFVAFGYSQIDANYPIPNGNGVETLVRPGDTGVIVGSGIYTGTNVLVYKNSVSESNLISELPVSGYSNDGTNSTVEFTYPNAFSSDPTDFYLSLKNYRGDSLNNKTFKAFRQPVISGFTPLSGSYGDIITVTGFFGIPASTWPSSNLVGPIIPSGVSIGSHIVPEDSQFGGSNVPVYLSNQNQILFEIPKNSSSDIITITTSGGTASSHQILTVFPPKPYISGYYPGTGEKPYTAGTSNTGFLGDQVFGRGNFITITGERMNLVTGVLFSGENDLVGVSSFYNQAGSSITFNVPASINPESGNFILKDFQDRSTDSSISSSISNKFPFPLHIASVSGLSSQVRYGRPFTLSGQNITGLIPRFSNPVGGLTGSIDEPTYSVDGDGVETLTVSLPRGIVAGSVFISGRGNPYVLETSETFLPLASAANITPGLGQRTVTTGDNILITGYNAYNPSAQSGSLLVGITGTGNKDDRAEVYFYPVTGYVSGDAEIPNWTGFRDVINFPLDSGFIGTGRFFIVNPWENFDDINSEFIFSESAKTLNEQINSYPFQYTIQGTRVNVTGFDPVRGVTGDNVTVSGEGFTSVSGVFFEIPDGPVLEADFTVDSDIQITATIPQEGIEARGMTSILLSGGTHDTIPDFEILLDTAAVKFNILEEGDVPADSTRTAQFSTEETHDGVVYIVTKTVFPDGTMAIVSSVPKP